MICKKNHVFYAIKTGKTEINSISKSIKSLRLNQKKRFVLFNLNCTPSIKHLEVCIQSMPKNFSSIELLKKILGETQISAMQKKIELNKTKECCLIAFEKNQKKAGEKIKKLKKIFKIKENNKLLYDKKRLKKIAGKKGLNQKTLKGFGENFNERINNFFIEKSALTGLK